MNTNIQLSENSEQASQVISSFHNYGLSWLIYTGLTLLMVAIIWYAIRNWHFLIKWFMASVIFAGALTPAQPTANSETYSPLILNGMVDLFDANKAGFIEAIKTISMAWAVLFALGIAGWFLLRHLRNKKSGTQPMDTEAQMATPVEPTIGEEAPAEPSAEQLTEKKDKEL